MHHEKVIPQKKVDFCNKLSNLFHQYQKIVLVSSENVNATQMLRIRHDLEGHAEIVFGKNSCFLFLNKGIFTNGSFNPQIIIRIDIAILDCFIYIVDLTQHDIAKLILFSFVILVNNRLI